MDAPRGRVASEAVEPRTKRQGASPTASSLLGTHRGLGQPALGGGGGTAHWAR